MTGSMLRLAVTYVSCYFVRVGLTPTHYQEVSHEARTHDPLLAVPN